MQFLTSAVVNIRANPNKWCIKEENVSRLMDLIDEYGDEVDTKIEQIKEL